MSARTDLLVYAPASDPPGRLHRHLSIEFKAHNAPLESIRKDLEKLLREGQDGLWFHVLQNVNSRTLVALFEKFRHALEDSEDMASACAQCGGELAFVFVITGKRRLLYRSIDPHIDPGKAFAFSYRVRQRQLEISDPNGWHVEAL